MPQAPERFDALIIGGGVIGCAVARELSRYRLRIGVLEKQPDICCETSARNSAVLHAGYNNEPGSRMAALCVAGNRGFDALAQELDIPYKRTGKLVVGFTEEDREALAAMKQAGTRSGVPGLELVSKAFIREKAPYVGGEFALWSGSTAILNPFRLVFALAENASVNGVQFFFNSEVTGISQAEGLYHVQTAAGAYAARWVINCAGLFSDAIAAMLGLRDYAVYPCRGEYFVLDKRIGHLLPLPVYPVPNYKTGGLGIHLTPTMEGNILVGPSTEYIGARGDYAATRRVMDTLLQEGARIFPHLQKEYFIRNFAGIRPKLTPQGVGGYHDFVMERRGNAIHLIGIESPGLTAAVPIAHEVIRLLQEAEPLREKPAFNPRSKRFCTFADKPAQEQAELIRQNPDYGEIICRCETITKAEVLAAMRGPLGASTITGVKYRCRAMMGRCQGGYCQTRIARLLQQEKGIPCDQLLYGRAGSNLFTGSVREP
ncbi:MAG: NAD(P)/FAD-dependent oxidoreductase [Christensenellaceae bacterium]|nr:NAD(P)/FAD-dependent oxidoreductase [Christensenellaceae bacterium]